MAAAKDIPQKPQTQDKSPEFIRLCREIHDRCAKTGDWAQVRLLQALFQQAIEALGRASHAQKPVEKSTPKRHAKV